MAVSGYTVRVQGLKPLISSFRKLSGEAGMGFKADLLKAAVPVVTASRSKISRFQGASLGTIKAVAGIKSVAVVQDARKVTGLRGDYGSLQMRVGLFPALEENTEAVTAALESALDRFGASEGF